MTDSTSPGEMAQEDFWDKAFFSAETQRRSKENAASLALSAVKTRNDSLIPNSS
jgi:hypothetical protein